MMQGSIVGTGGCICVFASLYLCISVITCNISARICIHDDHNDGWVMQGSIVGTGGASVYLRLCICVFL